MFNRDNRTEQVSSICNDYKLIIVPPAINKHIVSGTLRYADLLDKDNKLSYTHLQTMFDDTLSAKIIMLNSTITNHIESDSIGQYFSYSDNLYNLINIIRKLVGEDIEKGLDYGSLNPSNYKNISPLTLLCTHGPIMLDNIVSIRDVLNIGKEAPETILSAYSNKDKDLPGGATFYNKYNIYDAYKNKTVFIGLSELTVIEKENFVNCMHNSETQYNYLIDLLSNFRVYCEETDSFITLIEDYRVVNELLL